MKLKIQRLFAIILFGSVAAYGQQPTVEQLDEVVISDTRFELKREHSGKVITKITQEALQHLKGKSLAQVINTIAGIEINGSRSNAAQNLNYYVRGGRNRQVLVVIDGVALSDASQIANDYDLRLVDLDQIESIEILKGASSTLYGSGAATAVINITLKKAAKKPIALSLNSTLGTNQNQNTDDYRIEDFKNAVGISGQVNNFDYLARFGNQFTNGLSAVSTGTEPDAFNSINGYLNLGYTFSETFKWNTYAGFDNIKSDFDDSFTLTDADNRLTTNQYRIGIAPKFEYERGKVELNAAYNNIRRETESGFPSKFNAESVVVDFYNRHAFTQQFGIVTGLHLNYSTMESFEQPFGGTGLVPAIEDDLASFTIFDPYLNATYISSFGFQLNAGLRINTHNKYDTKVIYSVNPSYTQTTAFGYIKGLASYSTAYITPSLFQLYEPSFGNENLKPEENRTIEAGIELNITNTLLFNAVYFNRDEENFIDFVDQGSFQFQYTNVERSFTARGVELGLNLQVTENLALTTNFTYTDVEEQLQLRIPEFKVNTALNYEVSPKLLFNLAYQFNDSRTDVFTDVSTFQPITTTLQSYHLLDFYTSYAIIPNRLQVYGTLSNLFNERYEELHSFSTKGRNLSLGFALNF